MLSITLRVTVRVLKPLLRNQRCTVLSSPNSDGSLFHGHPDRRRKRIPSIDKFDPLAFAFGVNCRTSVS